jgi:thiol:disulfide interchange protein
MSKNKIFTVLAVIVMVAVYAFNNPKVDFKADNEEGIQFHKGTWNEALALAKKENKLIFLDIYATWCGSCKKLKKNTFSDEKVGQFYNSNFINVALDGEQAEGEILANQYHLTGYPSLLFIDSNGKVVVQSGGYQNSKDLIALGKSILKQ